MVSFTASSPPASLPMLFKQPSPRGQMTSMDSSRLCFLLYLVTSYLTPAVRFFSLATSVVVAIVGWYLVSILIHFSYLQYESLLGTHVGNQHHSDIHLFQSSQGMLTPFSSSEVALIGLRAAHSFFLPIEQFQPMRC